jgi:hypothetical protein
VPEELLSAVDDKSAAIIFQAGWMTYITWIRKVQMINWKGHQKDHLSGSLGKGLSCFSGVTVACRGDLESVYMTVG